MRNAWFGQNALIVLFFNGLIALLHVLEIFPYFYTLFFPLFCLLPLIISIVGIAEKDKNKIPAWIAAVLATGGLTYWVIALLIRADVI